MGKSYTKTQAKRALREIRNKAFKLTFPTSIAMTGYMSSKDFMAIDAIVQRNLKKLG